jgi:hypothetical protein
VRSKLRAFAFAVIVTLPEVLFNCTSSVWVGTTPPTQVPVEFQLPPPEAATMVAAGQESAKLKRIEISLWGWNIPAF